MSPTWSAQSRPPASSLCRRLRAKIICASNLEHPPAWHLSRPSLSTLHIFLDTCGYSTVTKPSNATVPVNHAGLAAPLPLERRRACGRAITQEVPGLLELGSDRRCLGVAHDTPVSHADLQVARMSHVSFGSTLVTSVYNFFSVSRRAVHKKSSRSQRSALCNPFSLVTDTEQL